MSIKSTAEFDGISEISQVVATTLSRMKEYAHPGMSAWDLDEYGGELLKKSNARSAPRLTYGFPGWTCISVNHEIAHGIPTSEKILKEGDLINIDVSAELNGYWSDNGFSFVLGEDVNHQQSLVDQSRKILLGALDRITHNLRINKIGSYIENTAKRNGFTVIRNLAGHGVGQSLHEHPHEILNCYDAFNRNRFEKNSIVAIETFISTKSTMAKQTSDGWTLVGNRGGYTAQHEHTIMVTEGKPIILTKANGL